MRERPETWSRPWLAMWAVFACATVSLAFALPFRTWAWVAAALFGLPEGVALLRRGDRWPPLTYVAAHYLPRWLTFTLVGFLTGSIAGVWFGFPRPVALGAVMGLFAWSLNHFDVTYDSRRRWMR